MLLTLFTLLKNLIRAVAVLVVVSFATFAMMFGNGTGVARSVLGFYASDEQVQAEVVRLGLDRPLLIQYGDWAASALTGDLGVSFYTGQPVVAALSNRVPVTLSLIIVTMLLTAIVAVALGVTAALYGGWVDRVVQFVSVLGAAVPPFIVAIGLIFAFAIAIPYFPATGYRPLVDGVQAWSWSITLPVLALLIGSVANAAQQFRGAVRDTLSQDWVRTLRARGISEGPLVLRHVLRNAAGPGLIVLSLTTLGLFGGALFIENVFALPGIGQLSVSSALGGDVPMVMGAVLVVMITVLVVNFLADLLTSVLNPKARAR